MSRIVNKLLSTTGSVVETDEFFNQTTLLLHGDGTSGSQNNTFLDSSSNNFTITRNGNTTQGSFSPYNVSGPYNPATHGGSGYFDGAGDYLRVADDPALEIGSGDFSIEFWYWADSWVSGSVVATKGWSSGAYSPWLIFRRSTSPQLAFFASSTGSSWDIADNFSIASSVSLNQWNHFVVCREGGTLSTFANGVRVSTTTTSAAFINTADPISIMADDNGANAAGGYVSDFRHVIGSSAYDPTATTITVPTAPLTAVSGTEFLCNFTNAGIFDSTGKNVLETVGNAQIDTAVTKFGTGSMEFDGTDDELIIPHNKHLDLSSSDFTIEGWVNFKASGTYFIFVQSGNFAFYSNSNRWVLQNPNNIFVLNWTPTLGQWYHFACVRNGGTATMYIDGSSIGSGSISNSSDSGDPYYIGGTPSTSTGLNAYLDDLRITKGVARYTANFTPPTKAFPDQ